MFPKTKQEFIRLILVVALTCALFLSSPEEAAAAFILTVVIAAAAACALIYYWMASPSQTKPVDIWAYQRELMRISDQRLPIWPTLTKDTLLYLALVLEEVGETAFALRNGLVTAEGDGVDGMLARLSAINHDLDHHASTMRAAIANMSEVREPMSPEVATEILDGVTDVAVVTAGLGLAAGLPARAGYLEVARSNLSKRNPSTGVIDKTPDGKWIKGFGYVKPDLAQVISDHNDMNLVCEEPACPLA